MKLKMGIDYGREIPNKLFFIAIRMNCRHCGQYKVFVSKNNGPWTCRGCNEIMPSNKDATGQTAK